MSGVEVQPFFGYRPPKSIDSQVACPPYDVLTSAEAREKVKNNPYSFLHVNKPEITLDSNINPYHDDVYTQGKKNLHSWIEKKWLIKDNEPSFYIYSQKMGDHEQFGFCCCVSIHQYEQNIIKKHENTTLAKEKDRTKLTKAQLANVGPVFLTYPHNSNIDKMVEDIIKNTPEHDFVADDDIQHKVWKISDPALINTFKEEFKKINALYVADGHHRAASAYNVGMELKKEAEERGEKINGDEPFNYFLGVLFPDNQLKILDYNRVVKDKISSTEFLEKIKNKFSITQVTNHKEAKPTKKGNFGLYDGIHWYILNWEGTVDPTEPITSHLDCQILTNNVLKEIFKIENLREDKRIDYVGGIRGLEELEKLVKEGEFNYAFALPPISVKEVMEVADKGLLLPPKATWFEPKLRSGLIVRLLENPGSPMKKEEKGKGKKRISTDRDSEEPKKKKIKN